jgi:hypothetical protein
VDLHEFDEPKGPFSISSLTLQTVRAGSFMRGWIFHRLTDIAISFSDFVVFIHSQFSSLAAAESRNRPAVVCLCICEIRKAGVIVEIVTSHRHSTV